MEEHSRGTRLQLAVVVLLGLTRYSLATSEPIPIPVTPPANGDLRLVHPDGCQTEGRLEIFLRHAWGTVCNDNFDDIDATVACGQLGYARGSKLEIRSLGTGNIWLDEVGCNPEDVRLLDCAHNPIGSNDCGHGEDVYIACFNGTRREYCPGSSTHNVVEGSLRLRDGTCADEGRLEIFHSNQWGTICDDGFGPEEATIACRQLGFDSGVVMKAPSPGTGTIWLDDLACTLQHSSIAECGASRWGREDCSHTEDAGIHCFNSTATVDCHGNKIPGDGALRLVGGECDFEGRLEIWHSHRWGTICDVGFDNADAAIACIELSYKTGWIHTAPSADASSQIWLKGINCTANSSRLAECSHAPWGSIYGCDHNKDVGIICSNTTERVSCSGDIVNHQDGDLRLRDGECASHGRLEVYHSGRWGTVCDDSFTDDAANVACRQLGYAMGFIKQAPAGTGITWLDNVQCTPTSRGRLADACRHASWGIEDCGHSEDIGIQCYNGSGSLDCHNVPFPPEGKLRLSDTNCSHSGRLEVFHAGRWGTVCDAGFDAVDIKVACREMGHQDGVLGASDVTAVASVLSQKRVWLKDVGCTSSNTKLINCSHSPWGATGCDHNQDVFLTCRNESAARDCAGNEMNFAEGQVRLVGGRNSSSGRLEIFHSGRWGTVCDDSFGLTDATVACRQLKFHRGVLGSRLLAPDGSGPTWLDELRCTPTDTKIAECHHNAWGREDCGHSEDVRLLCTNRTECESNPCQNQATCVTGFNSYTCNCNPGYDGVNCQINIDECSTHPCENGGSCQDGVNDYTCLCVEGYTDKNCSTDINDCANAPCKNGATCIDKLRGFTCKCALGYTGVNCETNIDECAPIPCHAGGKCTDGINDFTCACPPGYSGKRCEINLNECKSNPCKNNGTCLDGNNWYVCKCPPAYAGQDCGLKLIDVVPQSTDTGGGGKTDKHSAGQPAPTDTTTRNVAIAAIMLSLIAIIIAVVVIVRYPKGPHRGKAASLGDRRRADFRWQMLNKYPAAESAGDGREDEAAFYHNSSDKVNLVA